MQDRVIVVVSTIVDITIQEYQPDVTFKIFRSIDQLGEYLDQDVIRAESMFITSDVITAANSSFTYLMDLLTNNVYLKVDKVIYITEEKSQELKVLRYLLEEKSISNWEIIEGNISHAYVTDVINGTFRPDNYSARRKAVYRMPKSTYMKQRLKDNSTLDEKYPDDDTDLQNIPDEPLPEEPIAEHKTSLRKVYIAGFSSDERTALAFLAAQYLSQTGKTIIVESDPDYHKLSEFATKSGVTAFVQTVTDLFENPDRTLTNIRSSKESLVVIECIDRIPFNYHFVCEFLFHNLHDNLDYFVTEVGLDEIPAYTETTVVVPSTVIGCLHVGENVDKINIPYLHFTGVNLNSLPETRINSGIVMSTILSDILGTSGIVCPVVTISGLTLNGTLYDMGAILSAR